MRKNRKYYLVRFRGYGPEHDLWLPLAHLRNSMELIHEYHRDAERIISVMSMIDSFLHLL